MKTISGIKAAWMENDGLGALSVKGKSVVFTGADGFVVTWSCRTETEAVQQLRIFRAATKYPQTRAA
jgi:hypothetical protein